MNDQVTTLKDQLKKTKDAKQQAINKETVIVHTTNDEFSKVDSVANK